tara:strand:+ start:35 stop:511 length:477 start_codon:yes stop_codon:yes gene_type:complete
MNMKKISLDSWVQLIGMLSVVAGLVFVGLEMQQSQKIALAGQQANRVQLFSSMMDANNEQGIDQQKLQMILSGQIPMTKDYEWVVMNGLHRMWWIYENDFLQNELGLMDENIWQAKRNAMEANYNFCEGRPVFDVRKNTLDSRLVELVESFPNECADK